MKSLQNEHYLIKKQIEDLSVSTRALADLLRAVMNKEACARFRVHGFSMYPFIQDGDVVTLSPLQKQKLHIGDVIALELPFDRKLLVHRIIRVHKSGYLVKGDNQLDPDGLISPSSIIGQVIAVERGGKKAMAGLGLIKYIISGIGRTRVGFLFYWRVMRIVGITY